MGEKLIKFLFNHKFLFLMINVKLCNQLERTELAGPKTAENPDNVKCKTRYF